MRHNTGNMTRRLYVWLVASVLAGCFPATPAFSYVFQMHRNSQGQIVTVRWSAGKARAIEFWLKIDQFPFLDRHVRRLVNDSFAAWEEVPISFASFRNRGVGNLEVSTTDGKNVIVYDRSASNFPERGGGGVIAFARMNWDVQGHITDVDIVFNGRDYSYSVGNPDQEGGLVDMQDVLVHEIGHLLGLAHSLLAGDRTVRPSMYPFYFGEERTLTTDDRAGVSALYPSTEAITSTGAISGRVTRRDGSGAFGVHVVAYRADTGEFAAGVLSGTTGENRGIGGDGEYEIKGLPPGEYQVGIEPVGGSVTTRNFSGIYSEFESGFPEEYYDNRAIRDVADVVRVAPGRSVASVDFTLGTALPGFPDVQPTVLPNNTPSPTGPYRLHVRILDEDPIVLVEADYRIDGGPVQTLVLQPEHGRFYSAEFPGRKRGTVFTYRFRAQDSQGNETVYPAEELPALRFEVLALSGEPVVYVALRRSRQLAVYDTGLDREVARIPLGGDPLSVLLTPDERYVYVANNGADTDGSENKLMAIDTATHEVQVIRVGREPLDLAMSRNGLRVYVSNAADQTVSVVEVGSLREQRRISTPVSSAGEQSRGPFGIAVGPNEEWLYAADIDGNQVMVVGIESGQVTHRIDVPVSPRSLLLSPSGDRLYVSRFGRSGDGAGVSVIDTETNEVVSEIDQPAASVFRLALSPDGKRLYATDRTNGQVLVINTDLNRVILKWAARGRETRDVAVSADGKTVYAANQDSNELLFIDAASGFIRKTLTLEDGPRGIAVRGRPVYEDAPVIDPRRADFDRDGNVGFGDFLLFASGFGTSSGDPNFDADLDLNGDEQISFADFILFAAVFGMAAGG